MDMITNRIGEIFIEYIFWLRLCGGEFIRRMRFYIYADYFLYGVIFFIIFYLEFSIVYLIIFFG